MTAPLVVLAAGGTGGHVFPAEALAAGLQQRKVRLALFTDRRGDTFSGTLGDLDTYRIRAGMLAGKGLGGRLLGMRELLVGVFQAKIRLQRLRPHLVIGFGGYASFPTMLAARYSRCRTLIHEQNAVLGRANRALAPRVERIATAFAATRRLPEGSETKIVPTGMPVRPGFAVFSERPYDKATHQGPFHLLVLGGSQGARVFSDTVPMAVSLLSEPLRTALRICQQCRPEDLERVRAAYAATGVSVELASFFPDIPNRLAEAHLVIARAGASTVAELTTVGRPSVLVPYPFAADDHQTVNATVLAEAGGAFIVPQTELSPQSLASHLDTLWRNPETLQTMASRVRSVGRPDATARLVGLVMEMLEVVCHGGASGGTGENGWRAA